MGLVDSNPHALDQKLAAQRLEYWVLNHARCQRGAGTCQLHETLALQIQCRGKRDLGPNWTPDHSLWMCF
jgi:hypothetical protein